MGAIQEKLLYGSELSGHYGRRLLKKSRSPYPLISKSETTDLIRSAILSGEPFMAARFGGNESRACAEAFAIRAGVKKRFSQKIMDRMANGAGFFNPDEESLFRFSELMESSVLQLDLLGFWDSALQKYLVDKLELEGVVLTSLGNLEPYYLPENPWTSALKGKRVLVVHPFAESISRQHEGNREKLFAGTDILPEFQLETVRAVQTIAGNVDPRFASWFDALNYMQEEIDAKDFDVALIGCGAYGFPLAAHVKATGKQAVHLGGALQVLFGVMGKRWETNSEIVKYVNDAWTRPSESERPTNGSNVENGCYW